MPDVASWLWRQVWRWSSCACTRWLKLVRLRTMAKARALAHNGLLQQMKAWCTRAPGHLCFTIARARLSLMLPGWLLHLCLTRSMCAWLRRFVAIVRHDDNMFSRARGLAVRHSSFVVAYLLLSSLLLRDAIWKCQALALRISSSTYVVVTAVINSSRKCAWWLIDRIVVCCHRRTTIQSAKWSSCTCAWAAWRRHIMLPQPNGCRCCHRAMRYDNMVCLYTISRYSLSFLCDTDMKQKEGGCWQHMLLLHPPCCRRRCYTTLVVVKASRRLCLWANRVVVILSPLNPVDCHLSLWRLTIYITLVRMRISGKLLTYVVVSAALL